MRQESRGAKRERPMVKDDDCSMGLGAVVQWEGGRAKAKIGDG